MYPCGALEGQAVLHLVPWVPPIPYKITGFGAMDVTKPYKFKGFGALGVTKPYKLKVFGAMGVTTPYKFVVFGGGVPEHPPRIPGQLL